ncbi:hypothetical protein Dimus_024749 [Dionaea muscipula]
MKDEKQLVETEFFKESILNKVGLKRENGVWWLGSDSEDNFFDVVEDETDDADDNEDHYDDTDKDGNTQQGPSPKKLGQSTTARGIDPSSTRPDFQLIIHLQAQLHQAMQENARLKELLKQYQQPT